MKIVFVSALPDGQMIYRKIESQHQHSLKPSGFQHSSY
jgi:hypothetical protein